MSSDNRPGPNAGLVARIDHVVIAVRDLTAATEMFQAVGFNVEPGGIHTGRGTHNALIGFGLDYLELLSVYDAALTQAYGGNAPELVDYLARTSGGLIGYALAVDDATQLASCWNSPKIPLSGPVAMERTRPDGRQIRWKLLLPAGSGWCRPWPFLIEWEASDHERLDVEAPKRQPNTARRIAGVHVLVRSLADDVGLYTEQLGLAVSRQVGRGGKGSEAQLTLGPVQIRLFEPARTTTTLRSACGDQGIFQVDLEVDDLQAAIAVSGARPLTTSRGYLIPPHRTCGARIVLRDEGTGGGVSDET